MMLVKGSSGLEVKFEPFKAAEQRIRPYRHCASQLQILRGTSKRSQGHHRRAKAAGSAAEVAEELDVLASISLEHDEEGEYCMPGLVSVHQGDNKTTQISMQVKDYPGLLRVVAWVFNGLELLVTKAEFSTDEDGTAHNKFWVTDRAGQPLNKAAADLTAERLGDFVVYCTPSKKDMQSTFFQSGPITIDNNEHPDFTVVTVLVALEIEGALLKVTSALTNSGCSIQKGSVETYERGQNGTQTNGDTLEFGQHERIFKFWVTSRDGKKLDYMRAVSLLYTTGLVFGKTEGPLVAPYHSASSAEN